MPLNPARVIQVLQHRAILRLDRASRIVCKKRVERQPCISNLHYFVFHVWLQHHRMAPFAAIDGFYKIIIFQRIQELLSQLRVDGWVVDVMNDIREVMLQSLAAAMYRS